METYLNAFDSKALVKFWCSLNSWQFPLELERFKPANFDALPYLGKSKYIRPIVSLIETKVSEKDILREWNKERMTDIEFEIWWKHRKPISEVELTFLKEIFKKSQLPLNN